MLDSIQDIHPSIHPSTRQTCHQPPPSHPIRSSFFSALPCRPATVAAAAAALTSTHPPTHARTHPFSPIVARHVIMYDQRHPVSPIHPSNKMQKDPFFPSPSLPFYPPYPSSRKNAVVARTHTHTHTHTHNRAQEPKRVSRPSARSLARPPTLFIVPVPVPIPSAALFHSHSTATSALRCAAPTDLTCLPPIVAHRTLPIAHCPSPFWVKCLLRTCALAHTRCRIIIANLRKRWPRLDRPT
ncbi:hypothetical protein JOL62DRAFT_205841 [Phyllosticta paracitricarpa]|uniref:Uncharacterized protein n=1 Tax=Phyllosticta paracitricarpa TaxID=2016321 RepID=A0ABR1N356_9PEZI